MAHPSSNSSGTDRSVSKSLTIVDVQVAYEIDKKRWYLPRFVYQMVADDFGKTTFSKNGEVVVTMLKVPRPDLQFVVSDLAKSDPDTNKSVSNPPSNATLSNLEGR